MAIDIGLGEPEALEALARAVVIVDSDVGALSDEISEITSYAGTEVLRIAQALPAGPISFDRTMIAAAEAVRGALDQVTWILRNNSPTSMIVLQTLLRAALVGSGRVVFALLPAEPNIRLENARVLIAQEASGFVKALKQYAEFQQLGFFRPETDYLDRARCQNQAIQQGNRAPGDGVVIQRMADELATALAAASEKPEQDRQQWAELVTWLWNTLSGLAHTHAWPRLLPDYGEDQRSPGDFAGDFYMIATIAHVAMAALKHRLQPGSANTAEPVPLT